MEEEGKDRKPWLCLLPDSAWYLNTSPGYRARRLFQRTSRLSSKIPLFFFHLSLTPFVTQFPEAPGSCGLVSLRPFNATSGESATPVGYLVLPDVETETKSPFITPKADTGLTDPVPLRCCELTARQKASFSQASGWKSCQVKHWAKHKCPPLTSGTPLAAPH